MEIRIATTPEEKEQIYRLRYEVYVEELQWTYAAADDEKKELRDEWDDSAVLYYATEGGRIVGTIRLHFGGDLAIPPAWRDIYGLDRFTEFPESSFSFSSRLVVRPEMRGSTLVPRILLKGYEECWRRGARFNFCFCRPRLVDLYERLGFIRYRDNFLSETQGYVAPMLLLNEDAAHLKSVRSHFLRTCLAYSPSTETAEWFDRQFPGLRMGAAKQAMPPKTFCEQWGEAMSAQSVTLLHGLTEAQIECLVADGTVLRCRAGDTVVREGEAGHEMFLVLDGMARFSKRSEAGVETPLGTLGKGEVFGEMALLSRTKRTASVQAVTELQVLVISQEFLQRAMKALPDIAMRLLFNLNGVLCEKLRKTTTDWLSAISRGGSAEGESAGGSPGGGSPCPQGDGKR
jgi:CRP-like cAMP-binding protein/predicted GNAT family N-acyltransferase